MLEYLTKSGREQRCNVSVAIEIAGNFLKGDKLKQFISELNTYKAMSKKITDAGIYCNYFETYLDEKEFKLNNKGKFNSNCELGAKLKQITKKFVVKSTTETLEAFKTKKIKATELDKKLELITKLGKTKFKTLQEAEKALKI